MFTRFTVVTFLTGLLVSVSDALYTQGLGIKSARKIGFELPCSQSPLTSERTRAVQRTLQTAASLIIASTAIATTSASAKVYIDVDSYGDKELKIATVNKLKQKLRDAILKDISIAPELLQLAINDALGFDESTQDGGPDGSIQYELKLEGNSGLEKALQTAQEVKKELQRTNTVSLSDVISFAGAEALESAGLFF